MTVVVSAPRVPRNWFFIAHSTAGAAHSVQYRDPSTAGDTGSVKERKGERERGGSVLRARREGEMVQLQVQRRKEEKYLQDRVKCIFITTVSLFYLLDLQL